VLAVAFEYAGSPVDLPLLWITGFVLFLLLLVAWPVYFNRSVNHEGDYIDERWGYGTVDDDEWGLAVADARRAANRYLVHLAERADSRPRA
jgi:hypothetical protein